VARAVVKFILAKAQLHQLSANALLPQDEANALLGALRTYSLLTSEVLLPYSLRSQNCDAWTFLAKPVTAI
jgi:hypothetical protein